MHCQTHAPKRAQPTICSALLTVLLVIAAMPTTALAWGKEGHAIIALIARHYLTPKAAKAVDAMLAADAADTLTAPDMASRAAWADVWRNSHRDTAPWHFTDIEIDGSNTAELACAKDNCLTRRLSLFETQLALRTTPPADRVMALKFVLHFAGDLHQPLHLADNHDKGGNCVHLNGGNARENLHHFWDTVVVEAMGADTDTVASQLADAITPAQLKTWRSGDIDSWAMESHRVAERVTYSLQSQPGCGSSQDGPRYDLPVGYDAAAIRAARTQLQKAGVRLAVLLNKAVG